MKVIRIIVSKAFRAGKAHYTRLRMFLASIGLAGAGEDVAIEEAPASEWQSIQEKRNAESGRPIAILGYDFNTPDVLRTAIAFGFTPVLLHAPNGAVAAGTRIVISPEEIEALGIRPTRNFQGGSINIEVVDDIEFCQRVNQLELVVVVGSYGLRDRDYFRDSLLYARNRLKLKGQLLHPGFLADFYRSPNRRFAIIGFPGSGNMIFQNICSALSPAPSVPIWAADPLSAAVSQFALSYWFSLSAFLSGAFDEAGRWQDAAAPSHMRNGAIYIDLRDRASPAVVAGLPQRSYVWSNPWHTSHEPLTDHSLKFFAEQNFQVIQILRHPLDVIVSNAAKITALSGDRAPQVLLQNDDWVAAMLASVGEYYEHMNDHHTSNEVEFLRYEELLASPNAVIRRLASILGVECNEAKADEIWAALGKATLSQDRGHRWDPRAGKWREFISPRFAKRIVESPLCKYARNFGYEIHEESFTGQRAAVPVHKSDIFDIAWQDARWESSTGKQPAILHADVYRVHDQENDLLMVCSKSYAPIMESIRHSTVFLDMLAAARIIPWREPSLIAPYLKLK
jgi:hypothetical protein